MLHERVLSIREKELGVDHPLTLDTVHHFMSFVTYMRDDEAIVTQCEIFRSEKDILPPASPMSSVPEI